MVRRGAVATPRACDLTADADHCDDLPRRGRPPTGRTSGTGRRPTEECLDGRTDVDVRAVHRVGQRLERAARADAATDGERRDAVAAPGRAPPRHGGRRLGLGALARRRRSLWLLVRLHRLAGPARRQPPSSRIDPFSNKPTTSSPSTTSRRRSRRGSSSTWSCRSVGVAAAVTVLVPRDRPADGVLHRQGRQAVGPAGADRGGAAAAVGRLPRQGLRLEGDAAAGLASSASTAAAGSSQSVFGWTPGFGWIAVVLALTYLWLPYMVLPIYAGLERLPAVAARRLRRPRRPAVADVPLGGRAAARPVDRRRVDLHVLAVARRLHHPQGRHRGQGAD